MISPDKLRVFMIPKNHEYIKRLKINLESLNIAVKILKPFHYSTFTNIVKLLLFRLKGYKIIHVHWLYVFPFSFVMRWFCYFCNATGIKIIWEMHNIIPHHLYKNAARDSKWFYEKVDGIILHSKNDIARSRDLLGTDENKMHIIIPHGNFIESYENKISKKDARIKLRIPDDKKVILCFGFIRENRGYEYLIEATNNMLDTIVIIAGKVLEKKVYEKLLNITEGRPDLKIFGKWIPDDEIQIYFNACDIVVLPYVNITTSGVIPLAYTFSRPVITTEIGGLKDIVNEKTGILIPPENVGELKKAIGKMLSMNYEGMGRYAYEYAKKEFSWEINAKNIKSFYELMLVHKMDGKMNLMQ